MDEWSFKWKTDNYLIYLELFVKYTKTKSVKRKKEMERELICLKSGLRPIKFL